MNVELHKRCYLGLAILVFALVGAGHALRLFYSWEVAVAGIHIPPSVSWWALVVALSMVLMGAMYLRR